MVNLEGPLHIMLHNKGLNQKTFHKMRTNKLNNKFWCNFNIDALNSPAVHDNLHMNISSKSHRDELRCEDIKNSPQVSIPIYTI